MAVQADIPAGIPPKGNYMARRLKLMNDFSKELFPQTPADIKPTKFDSMYTKDYKDYPTEVFLEGLAPKGQQPEWETIRDVLFGNSPTSMFANWRIPRRIAGECEDAKIGDHIGKVQPEKLPTPKLLRQSTLPAIPVTRDGPKNFTPKPRISASELHLSQSLRRSKTCIDMPPSRAMQQKMKERVGEWKERLPDVDPRLLEKVLRMQASKEQASEGSRQALRGSLLPDARRSVERWLESASEAERQVALQFFTSLTGGRLMGANGSEQGARLKEVIATLKSSGSRWVAEGNLSPRAGPYRGPEDPTLCDDGKKGLKYLNLLGPDERQQRWMHTSWHHLPNYRLVDPVNNWSSHYVQPHRAPHRHFVIHPDWPPQGR